jgi:hypothetical protein
MPICRNRREAKVLRQTHSQPRCENGMVVSTTLRPLYPHERAGTNCKEHRVGLRAGKESPHWPPSQVYWVRTSVCLPHTVIPFALFTSVFSDECQESILTRATTLTTHVCIFISLDAIKRRPFQISCIHLMNRFLIIDQSQPKTTIITKKVKTAIYKTCFMWDPTGLQYLCFVIKL